jgi:uncharacterized protein YpuA (DUF1002 family)
MKLKIASRSLLTTLIVIFLFSILSNVAYADSFKTVTLGGDLNDDQRSQMLTEFGVSENEANVIEVTIDEERKYLEDTVSDSVIGTKSISCSYVEPTDNDELDITVTNLTWVNENMIKNALITAGIQSANVKASAPYEVSGTAALTGIMKGFENSEGGAEISEEQKQIANDEIVVTGNLADEIGQDEAAGLMNEIKTEVIKENPESNDEVEEIVVNVINNYNYEINEEHVDEIVNLMVEINGLGLDFSKLKDSLESVGDNLKDVIGDAEVAGFFNTIGEKLKEAPAKIIILSVIFFIFGIISLINPLFTINLAKSISASGNGSVRIAGIVIIIISILILF